jgi:excisionase family DNA binding protein
MKQPFEAEIAAEVSKALYRVSEASDQLSLGRTKTYELIRRGLIRTVRIDSSVRIPAAAISEFVNALEARPAAP